MSQSVDLVSPSVLAFEAVYVVLARKYCEPHRILFEQSFVSERKAANFAYLANMNEIIKIGGYNEKYLNLIILSKPDLNICNNLVSQLKDVLNIMKQISKETSKKFLEDTQFTQYYVMSIPYQKKIVTDLSYVNVVEEKFQELKGMLRVLRENPKRSFNFCGLK